MKRIGVGRLGEVIRLSLVIGVVFQRICAAETTVGSGFDHREWTIPGSVVAQETKVSQEFIPMTVSGTMLSQWDFRADLALVRTDLARSGTPRQRLDGATSASVEFRWHSNSARQLVQISLAAPTTGTRLSAADLVLLRLASAVPLGFAVHQYSRGPEAGISWTASRPVGLSAIASLGAGGILRGSYDLLDQMEPYLPASEGRVTAGMGYRSTDMFQTTSADCDVTLRAFSQDRIGSSPAYQEGAQLEVAADAHTARRLGFIEASAACVLKRKGSVADSLGAASLVTEQTAGNAAEVRILVSPLQPINHVASIEWCVTDAWGSSLLARNGHSDVISLLVALAPYQFVEVHLRAGISTARIDAVRDIEGVGVSATLSWRIAP